MSVRVRFPPEHICLYRDSQIIAAGDGPGSEASP